MCLWNHCSRVKEEPKKPEFSVKTFAGDIITPIGLWGFFLRMEVILRL